MSIKIDGMTIDANNYRLYNIETQNELLINESLNKSVYTILFGDTTEINQKKENLSKLVLDLEKHMTEIIVFKNEVSKAEKELIGKITKENLRDNMVNIINKSFKMLRNLTTI